MFICRVVATILLCAAVPEIAAAQVGPPPIEILAASFGRPGNVHGLDIAPQLGELCAGAQERCDVFCSPTSFGRHAPGSRPFARRAVCRATWRCPDGNVHSVEAAKEEPILMRCIRAKVVEPAVDELPPPTYTPPGR